MDDRNGRKKTTPPRGSGRKTDDYSKEGVYYTPGEGSARKTGERRNTSKPPQQSRAAKKTASPPPKKKGSKTQYIAFYMITLVVAVIVCLAVFFAVFTNMVKDKTPDSTSPSANPAVSAQPSASTSPITAVDEVSVIGVVRTVNSATKSLGLFDISSMKTYTFDVDGSTTMQNKYGESMSFAEFKVGDIVDARYTELGGVLTSMTISTRAWEHKNVSNVKVNAENSTISIGNDTYTYDNKDTIALFNGEPYNIADIDTLNVVTLRGMGNNVWYVEISKGIGFIDVINGEGIKDGVIEIDNNMTMLMNDKGGTDEIIKVQSGSRKVIVKGSNIEIYTTTIDVNAEETAILDLSTVQVTAGVLTLNISEADAVVTIDGSAKRASEPQILTYGSHDITVTKGGFKTYESTFEMNEPTLELDISLEKEIKLTDLTIITTPSGADVYIDNAYVGISPVTTPVEDGIRTITVKKTGYIDVVVHTDNYHTEYQIGMRAVQAVDPVPNYQQPSEQPTTNQPESESYVPIVP